MFVLRRRDPDAARPFRAWGYPWAPAVFVVASALMLGNEIWRSPGPRPRASPSSPRALPVYWWMARRASESKTHSVTSANAPSLQANNKNDGGELRTK